MRWSERLGRVALVAFGLLIAVVALEVALQIAAGVVRATGSGPSTWDSGSSGNRILCLGDSNTYGVWLADRETEAWPPQLEAVWNESEPSRRVEVLNAGYPGTNSSRLLRDLPALLEAFRPDLLIVMVGVNDGWTEPVVIGERENGPFSFGRRHSRVLRLARLLRPRLAASHLEVTREPGGGTGDGRRGVVRFGEHEFDMGFMKATPGRRGAWDALVGNLRQTTAQADDLGIPIALMTYPSNRGAYGRANLAIREAAGDDSAMLIDLAEVFRPLCPRQACPQWLYEDQHPRALGYRLVAETIAARLREAR